MHRCISVEIPDAQPFWPAMFQTTFRVTLDVAPNGEWEVCGIELADVRKAALWHPITEDHATWLILTRYCREPYPDDLIRDAIGHVDWTAKNWLGAGHDPASMSGLVGHGIMVLDQTDSRRARAIASGATRDDDAIREREDPKALSLT